MNFNEYQYKTKKTAIYPQDTNLMAINYTVLGLGNEAGEIQGKLKKVYRDKGGLLDADIRLDMADELGDVLWYLARLADELGYDLSFIAERNISKLEDRAARGTLQGSGDKR